MAKIISGGPGNDKLSGTSLDDILRGGAGNDTLTGGAGRDAADYRDATKGVKVNLSLLTAQQTGWGKDLLISIENLIGSRHADTLIGDLRANLLQGEGGDDSLSGSSGNDTLEGGAGNDTLNGGSGSDTASYAGATGKVTVDLSKTGPQGTATAGMDTLISIERLIGGNFGDLLIGNKGANALSGGKGADTIYARSGNDTLLGGSGNDKLYGEDGNDRIVGGTGDDILEGGNGNDTIVSGSGVDSIFGGAGIDTLDLSGVGKGLDIFVGTSGYEYLSLGNVLIWNDMEAFIGTKFADRLKGTHAADTINGGAGNDTLVGGDRGDMLTGGSGSDRFVYVGFYESDPNSADRDWIRDFEFGKDKIDLSGVDAVLNTGANEAFKLVKSFTKTSGELTVVKSGGQHLVRGDINGDGKADIEIAVNATTVGTFKTSDFIL